MHSVCCVEESEKLSILYAGDGQGSGCLLLHSLSTCKKVVYRPERLEAALKNWCKCEYGEFTEITNFQIDIFDKSSLICV